MLSTSFTAPSIRQFVDTFYARVRADAMLSPVFEEKLAGKWDDHLARLSAFWTKVLLGTGDFHGNVFNKHMVLNGIEKQHFVRWLALFNVTAVEMFGPEDARIPVRVAERMAAGIQVGYFSETRCRYQRDGAGTDGTPMIPA